jgi:hypothetical protein
MFRSSMRRFALCVAHPETDHVAGALSERRHHELATVTKKNKPPLRRNPILHAVFMPDSI